MRFFNLKKWAIAIVIMALPLVFVNISNTKEHFLLRGASFITGGFQQVYFRYRNSIRETLSQWMGLLQIKTNNQSLKKENARLKVHLMQMRELELQNERLKNLFAFKKKSPFRLLPVRITAMDPFPSRHTLLIDKGAGAGVKKNKLALSEEGVLGYVLKTKEASAQILLLEDSRAVLPAMVQRSGALGLIEGQSPLLSLNYLGHEDDVKEGDLIVTSSLTGDLPEGLPIGIVQSARLTQDNLKKEVEVKPLADFSKIKEFFIILQP